MLRLILLQCFIIFGNAAFTKNIVVKNATELKKANKEAAPGDTIVLQNGNWNDITINLNCNGTKDAPILFKAATPGKVVITGNSKLKIGGSNIIIDGFYFTNGYAGDDAVITFRSNSKELANNCRVTNTTINDFNNPKRLDENYWVALYGKNNRLDHCSFFNKNNIGVLLAVILDDDRSRENFHSIDHNYFGVRLPLASNGGEIIRVGVSQHCEFNSNTQIIDNFFEHCDGEGEVISIKSCRNIIRNNLFKECQGSVVLRHGNYNTVENNVFLGNGKAGSGGVRIINKGQWVVNNFFYKCIGDGFRSPLSIMNGVPNSPANRYLEVSEAVISNNSFYECAPISFCEGSDTERSVQPHDVKFLNNIFYTGKDRQLYNIYDDISRISFSGNLVSKTISQELISGFTKTSFTIKKSGSLNIPGTGANTNNSIPDSLLNIGKGRLLQNLSPQPGFTNLKQLQYVLNNATAACGAKWYNTKKYQQAEKQVIAVCKNAEEIIQLLDKTNATKLIISLTEKEYTFNSPLNISKDVSITGKSKQTIKFSFPATGAQHFIQLKAGYTLSLKNLNLDLSGVMANNFITTDTSGNSHHNNFSLNNCIISNSNGTFFRAAVSSVADSIVINNNSFTNGNGDLFMFAEETDKKGYYNVEQLKITNNQISNRNGRLLSMIRTGNDESTMGPLLLFSNNKITNCSTEKEEALISLYGTQRSFIEKNSFTKSNEGKILIQYTDKVRAVHILDKNKITGSGKIESNKFVTIKK